MQYQLPTGKVIYLSVEEYLSLSDQDIQDLSASNLGDYPTSPWAGSALRTPRKAKEPKDIDKSIDYNEDSEELRSEAPLCTATIAFITIDDINLSEEDEDGSEEPEDT